MSRNVRQKYPTTPVKARKPTKRRGSDSSSSLNLSDDDEEHGYSGVEDVSDSDDDEEHVFAAEEEHIIHNATRQRGGSPRPVEEDDDADEENEDDEAEEDAGDESASWDGILSESDNAAAEQPIDYLFDEVDQVIERHVRFTGVPDSDSESTTSETSEDHHGFFPDIFVAQNNLDPAFRREIEYDDDDASSNSGSFWDFGGSQDLLETVSEEDDDATPTATPMPSCPPTAASTPTPTGEVHELDGYETDGDTTEEDVPEPPARRKQMRRYPTVEVSSDSETEKPTPYRRGKPRIGRFNLDRSEKKPIAVLNPATRKMMIFTPQRLSRLDLSPESFNVDYSQLMQPDPIFSPITNPGLLGMLSSSTFGDVLNTQPFGPTEAFFPVSDDTHFGDGSDDSEFGMVEDEGEAHLKLDDFLVLNSDSEDEEENVDLEWNGEPASSPSRPRTAASGTTAASTDSMFGPLDPLLVHLTNNSNVVGAFRRNQITQQLINSDKASQDSLAFSNPYHHGTLRGIKSGSLESVTTPITPVRRHKKSSGLRAVGADLQGSPQQKRKASTNLNDSLHKKQRSISDMDLLNLAGP
ncbi:hypothetical protein OQA88_2166 [Cercophora sp. LCS_1]